MRPKDIVSKLGKATALPPPLLIPPASLPSSAFHLRRGHTRADLLNLCGGDVDEGGKGGRGVQGVNEGPEGLYYFSACWGETCGSMNCPRSALFFNTRGSENVHSGLRFSFLVSLVATVTL